MRRTPPDEGPESRQDPDTAYPARRRQRATEAARTARLQQKDFYSDEHPEVPKVRRASLYLDAPYHHPAIQRAQPRREQPYRAEDEEEMPPISHTSHKVMVAQRRRRAVYEPPSGHHSRPHHTRGRQRQPRQPLLARLQLGQHRTFLLVCGILLALVMMLPLLFSTTHTFTPHGAAIAVYPGSAGNTDAQKPASTVIPASPHDLVITPPAGGHPAPPVLAASAYLLDADTGVTLYASNPLMHLPMLSTTKLMTALLAAELGNPDQNITITDAIGNDLDGLSPDSSLMYIKRGETYTLRELLYGMMLVSGNDAAVAIADTLTGSQQNFVAKMNARADQLGLHDTHYSNPHGLLADGHYSSAHDLAVLAKYSFGNPLIHQITGTRQYTIPQTAGHPEHLMRNGNQFLWWYPGVDGGKPGWDAATNFVQVVSCVRNHHHLIGAVMHTVDWWTDMRDLMNYGFNTFAWISPRDVQQNPPIPFAASWGYFVKDKKENTLPTGDQGRYYIATGYSISKPVIDYFDANGGLNTFGFPSGQPRDNDKISFSQRFEHGTIQCDRATKQCKKV